MKDWRTTHGHSKRGHWSPEYHSWLQMKQRCDNANNDGYRRYGGRGVRVCESWYSFENFLADMGHRPSAEYSIERINNDGNYEMGNCKWASPAEQARNRVDTVFVEYAGKRLCLKDWAKEIGISYITFYTRWSRGWSIERIASQPVQKRTYA
jgi:hypothetical protein